MKKKKDLNKNKRFCKSALYCQYDKQFETYYLQEKELAAL